MDVPHCFCKCLFAKPRPLKSGFSLVEGPPQKILQHKIIARQNDMQSTLDKEQVLQAGVLCSSTI